MATTRAHDTGRPPGGPPVPIPAQTSACGLPSAGEWTVVGRRSRVAFSGRASRLAPTVRACFPSVSGQLHLAPDLEASRVAVSVDVRSVTTSNPMWDDLLRAADPFRAQQFPQAHYVSTAVRWTGSGFAVTGVLSLAGADVDLRLTAAICEGPDQHVTLRACGSIEPRAAGVTLDLPGGRLLTPRTLALTIDAVAAPAVTSSRRFALAS